MTQTNRFWKFVLISLFGILAGIAALLSFIWYGISPDQQAVLIAISQDHIYTLILIAFLVTGALWAIFDITYNRYILPLKRVSAEAGMIYDSNPSHRIHIKGSRDIIRMAEIINDFADMFENLNQTITQQILSARKETEKERNLLAAIMGELPQGIIICNKNGRIILFNTLARTLFSHDSRTGSQEQYLGLGRSIFHLIDKTLIAHALNEITEQMNIPDASIGSFFITPIRSGRLISAEAIPVLDTEKRMTGFILVIEDVSGKILKYQFIDQELTEFAALLKNSLPKDADLLTNRYEPMGRRIRQTFFSSLPSTQITLDTFLPVIQRKIGYNENIRVNIFNPFPLTRFLADTYSMTQAFLFLFKDLCRATGLFEFDLLISQEKKAITFKINWEGPPCPLTDIKAMLKTRLNSLPSLGYVLKFNNARLTEITRDDRHCTGLTIQARAGEERPKGIRKKTAPVVSDSRPEFYDFDLFHFDESLEDILETPLRQLTYTVFDTETTGLDPDGGDEIISIGAVRIVNGRIVYKDCFEELVNPKRSIPMDSYKIHGISYEMVKEKQTIREILPLFKKFSANTVLLGHNLAFDLKMFKVKEGVTGVKLVNPFLDTLLLSAVLHPVHEKHDMENIAKRLGVSILGRHTSLGDAITTAEIFLKLLPMLTSNGILTLKDAIAASKKTYYARLKY